MSLANISLVGNLVKAPERIEFSSGRVKTTLVVAVNSLTRSTGKTEKVQTADFYRVETWGKLADLAARCLFKGNQITVTGRLILDHWTDRQGLSRITPVVEANQLSLPPKNKRSVHDNQLNDDKSLDEKAEFLLSSTELDPADLPD